MDSTAVYGEEEGGGRNARAVTDGLTEQTRR
jgi:hypothetical protein